MFSGFAALLKLLWPFFQESMLQDGTLRDWLKRNRSTCILILFQIIMLGVVFWMVEMVMILRQQEHTASTELSVLTAEHDALRENNTELKVQIAAERQANNRMRVFLVSRCKLFREPCDFLIEETIREPFEQHKDNNTPAGRKRWCDIVQESDLDDGVVRLRYLRDCMDILVDEPHIGDVEMDSNGNADLTP